MALCQVISILHLYPHVYTQGVTNCRSEKWTINFCTLWKWTLQTFVVLKIKNTIFQKSRLQTFVIAKTQKVDPTKFCSLKGQGYYISEKQTTNFCSLKKQTLPSFVVSKIKNSTCQKSRLQTFVISKTQKADPTKLCSLKGQGYYMSEKWTTNFCSLKKQTLPSFVVSKIKTISQKSRLQTFVIWKSRHYKLL